MKFNFFNNKIKHILFFFFLMFIFKSNVFADTIYNLDMNVYLNKDGSANITEIWDVQADSGSEWYKQLYGLGNQEISNFKVYMDDRALTYKEWDVDQSISQKSGYYGINRVSEGIELCFGKGDMRRHKFRLSYNLSNVIFNTDGNQVLYQTFFPNVTAEKFSVTVSSYYKFDDTLDVWGYGYKGYAYVENGYIKMSNEENTSLSDDYVVLLVKFPQNVFDTTNYDDRFGSFDSVLKMAKEGTYEYDYGTKESVFSKIINFLLSFGPFIIFTLIAIFGSIFAASKNTKYRFGVLGNKVKKDVNAFRDIPCNKDIFRAYWVAKNYNLMNKKEDFLGAILLKWLMNGNVKIEKVMSGTFRKKEESNVCFIEKPNGIPKECDLYDWMVDASGDNKLESGEFKKWCRKNYTKIIDFFDDIDTYEKNVLLNEGKVRYTEEKKGIITHKYYDVDDSMMIEAEQMAGLKKFLKEFSVIDKREAIEVNLWNEYLIYAQIFGIADKVAKQFKKLYPEIMENMNQMGYDYDDIFFIYMISDTGVASAKSARDAANSYSGGGGGFASGGGGFGSFGGGGSMGGR